jgi:YegS/Rv2252/BmrU family lipid kinase
MQASKRKIFFIINPVSGTTPKWPVEKEILAGLDRTVFEYSLLRTTGPGDAAAQADLAKKLGADVVVAVGGDGSINEVAGPLIGTDIAVGVIPSGSGNGLARHLRIPLKCRNALGVLNRMKTCRIDTGLINGRHFINLAGLGFDGWVAYRFSKSARRGFIAYSRSTLGAYISYRSQHFTLRLDGRDTIETKALFVTCTNSSQFGYQATLAPHADLMDGKLDVCIVEKPPLIHLPAMVCSLFTRKFDRSSHVRIYRAGEIRVQSPSDLIANIDGEPFAIGREVSIQTVPRSLTMVVP